MSSEVEFVKEMEFFTSHHVKHGDSPDAPADVSSQKDAIFRNIEDIKAFHGGYWSFTFDIHYFSRRFYPKRLTISTLGEGENYISLSSTDNR